MDTSRAIEFNASTLIMKINLRHRDNSQIQVDKLNTMQRDIDIIFLSRVGYIFFEYCLPRRWS